MRKVIGAYTAAMGGVDAVVFTAGVGENDSVIREWIISGFEYMGIVLDKEKNSGCRVEADVSAPESKVRIFVIPTNEELVIAMDTAALCK